MSRTFAVALVTLLATACLPPDDTEASEPAAPVCTATYQGPGTRTTTTCGIIYEQRCLNGNTSGADANCSYALTDAEAAACPYCAPHQSSPPPSSGGSNTSCNSSGVAYGCHDGAPFSCPASNTCYASYSQCTGSSECSF